MPLPLPIALIQSPTQITLQLWLQGKLRLEWSVPTPLWSSVQLRTFPALCNGKWVESLLISACWCQPLVYFWGTCWCLTMFYSSFRGWPFLSNNLCTWNKPPGFDPCQSRGFGSWRMLPLLQRHPEENQFHTFQSVKCVWFIQVSHSIASQVSLYLACLMAVLELLGPLVCF